MTKRHLFDIKLGHHSLPVYHNPDLERQDLLGCYSCDKGIELVSIENRAADTFFHETLHYLSNLRGIGLKENQVRALEQGLIDLVRDNPEVLLALAEGKMVGPPVPEESQSYNETMGILDPVLPPPPERDESYIGQ